MKLDIGCGFRSHGDINLDLEPNDSKNRKGRGPIPTKNIKNFIKGDARFLPFPDKIFSITYCIHVLEHIPDSPFKVLKEIQRVTNGNISIKVPGLHRAHAKEFETHYYSWSKDSLKHLLDLIFKKVEVYQVETVLHKAHAKIPILRKTIGWIIKSLEKDELIAICTTSENRDRIPGENNPLKGLLSYSTWPEILQ